MPPKSSRKPSMRKAKRMIAKSHKGKAKKNMDTFFLKAKSIYNVVPTQGGSVANYVFGYAPLLGGNLLQNAEFNLYRLQYDKYRVNSVTAKWIPKANVLDMAVAQNDTSFNLTGDGAIHTCIDRDGQAPTSTAAISRYPSYSKKSLLKTWSRTYSIKYPMGVWMDCQDPFGNTQVIATLGLAGGVSWYAENFIEDNYEFYNEPVAALELSWSVVFQGKTSASLTFATDENGLVVGVTMTPFQLGTTLSPSPLTNIRGTIADTRLVDETNDVPIDDQGQPIVIPLASGPTGTGH